MIIPIVRNIPRDSIDSEIHPKKYAHEDTTPSNGKTDERVLQHETQSSVLPSMDPKLDNLDKLSPMLRVQMLDDGADAGRLETVIQIFHCEDVFWADRKFANIVLHLLELSEEVLAHLL